jgi:hypothetical protein
LTYDKFVHVNIKALPRSEAADVATSRRSIAVACLLTGGRCSPEGERAIVELSRCDTISREPEPINPRVGTGERRVPFPDSDEVGSSDGGPKVSSGPLLLARVRDFFTSIRFFLNLIRILFLFMCGDLFPERQHLEGFGGSGAVVR